MPFQKKDFDGYLAPRFHTSEAAEKGWTEQSLYKLLCNSFSNQQDWMDAAKQVLWHPETTPEVSVL